MRSIKFLLGLGALLASAASLPAVEKMADGVYAEFTTPRGAFVVELNYREAPMTVASFVGLAEGTIAPRHGQPFFTGLKWYRVVPGFVIQSGDPEHEAHLAQDDDAPNPHVFPDEFAPGLHHPAMGVLSMANAGPDTNGCEFFVTLADCTRLNYLHSVFGRVFTGLDVLPKIQQGDAFTIKILRVGEAGRAFRADAATFQALVARAAKYTGETEPGPTAHFDDPLKVLPVEVPRAKNFNFKLNNFERATGRRLFARVFPSFTPTAEAATPAALVQQLSHELKLDRSGVLAVYFADQDQWHLWIGDELMPVFNPAHERAAGLKNALYEKVRQKAAEYVELTRKTRGPDKPITPADRAKCSIDAMLDELIFRFEPKP